MRNSVLNTNTHAEIPINLTDCGLYASMAMPVIMSVIMSVVVLSLRFSSI